MPWRRDYGSQAGETGSSEDRCEDRVHEQEHLLGAINRMGSWKWLKGLSDHTTDMPRISEQRLAVSQMCPVVKGFEAHLH